MREPAPPSHRCSNHFRRCPCARARLRAQDAHGGRLAGRRTAFLVNVAHQPAYRRRLPGAAHAQGGGVDDRRARAQAAGGLTQPQLHAARRSCRSGTVFLFGMSSHTSVAPPLAEIHVRQVGHCQREVGVQSLRVGLRRVDLGIKHLRTKPYTPKNNSKVERLVQTSLRERAYARPFRSSALRERRTAALYSPLDTWHRPHSALAHQPPMIRIPAVNDLMKLNS